MDLTAFQAEHGIIGQSVEIQEVVQVIRQVAPTDITVLITGESGVGKEVIARAIHDASKRSQKSLFGKILRILQTYYPDYACMGNGGSNQKYFLIFEIWYKHKPL